MKSKKQFILAVASTLGINIVRFTLMLPLSIISVSLLLNLFGIEAEGVGSILLVVVVLGAILADFIMGNLYKLSEKLENKFEQSLGEE